jgi:thiamine biosynthesis lipoprotein
MGTTVDVLVPVSATSLVPAIESLFLHWEATLTRFDTRSELARLNASAGQAARVSPFLFQVVEAALEAAATTAGTFDPTLLNDLIALGYDRTFAAIRSLDASARSPVRAPDREASWRDVRLDRAAGSITLPPGVGLDLAGIAKGMAVDAALETITAAGCTIGAVDAGGDLAVIGAPTELGWPIRIELPDGWRVISVAGGAVATSGTSRRRWRMGDAEMHHLLDPRTRRPVVTDLWSVSVTAGTCRDAEVAATTAFILGADQGSRWLCDRGIDALFVFEDGRQLEAGPWSIVPAGSRSTAPGGHP